MPEEKKELLKELLEKIDLKEKLQEINIDGTKIKLSKSKDNKPILDKLQSRLVSRKLLVFAIATILFTNFGLDAEQWGYIAMTYIGGQSLVDFAKYWRA